MVHEFAVTPGNIGLGDSFEIKSDHLRGSKLLIYGYIVWTEESDFGQRSGQVKLQIVRKGYQIVNKIKQTYCITPRGH